MNVNHAEHAADPTQYIYSNEERSLGSVWNMAILVIVLCVQV